MLCRSKKRPEEKTPELPVSSLDGPERETTPEPSSSGRITYKHFKLVYCTTKSPF